MVDRQPIHLIPQVAEGFVDRLHKQHRVFDIIRDGEEYEFPRSRGDYSGRNFIVHQRNLRTEGRNTPIEDFTGVEEFLAQNINYLLNKSTHKPVIALDIGGMAGLSWCRLASHFSTNINNGNLHLVVSNIVFDPQKDIPKLDIEDDEQKKFIEKYSSLVHYIQADSSNLSQFVLDTANGKVSLAGNVDFLHEESSVTLHSQIPEWDIPQIVLPLLSDRGIYLTANDQPNRYFYDGDNYYQRREGLRIAREELEAHKLINVFRVESGSKKGSAVYHCVYKRSPHTKIRFD